VIHCNCSTCQHNYLASSGLSGYCALPIAEYQIGSTGSCVNYLEQLDKVDFSELSTMQLAVMLYGTPDDLVNPFIVYNRLYQEFLRRNSRE